MNIDKVVLLKKIISINSCIIEGQNIKDILAKETHFFNKQSGASVILLCIEGNEHVEFELILEEEPIFANSINKYGLTMKKVKFDKYSKQCSYTFSPSREYFQIDSLYDLFKEYISKEDAKKLEKALNFSNAHLFYLYNKSAKNIGFVIYIFDQEGVMIYDELRQVTDILQMIISPLYNQERHILQAKCVQIDYDMYRLTKKEKLITNYIFQGLIYAKISEELNISINTLKSHIKHIFSKYGVSSKIELLNKLTENR